MGHGRTTLVKIRTKMGARHWARSRPKADNPHGVSTEIMRQLASENIADVDTYNKRLKELLAEKSSG